MKKPEPRTRVSWTPSLAPESRALLAELVLAASLGWKLAAFFQIAFRVSTGTSWAHTTGLQLMKKFLTPLCFAPLCAHAADLAPSSWHPDSLVQAIGYMLLFAFIGILAAIAGYRLFDKFTPGDLHKEIFENKNVAAALVGGAVILGVCIIVAAAMLG